MTTVALLHSAAFIWGVLQLRPGARRALAAQLERGRVEEASLAPGRRRVSCSRPSRALPPRASRVPRWSRAPGPTSSLLAGPDEAPAAGGQPVGAAPVGAAPGATARLVPAWYDRPSWTEMGPIAWLRARVGETPFRPDRSASLDREPRGRLDRLDLFLLVVFVVGALVLRTYRLGEPARMHFDEVYHARTATEFLQSWRYDISHDIYEWTHPHLAKYAMAAGIVAFAGHDVASASDLGVPVRDAAIEPRREEPSGSGDRAGDRVWVATGSELVAYDLATRGVVARWALPGASAVAFDETGLQAPGRDGRGRPVRPRHHACSTPTAAPTRRTPGSTPLPVTTRRGAGDPARRVPRRLPRGGCILADGTVAVVDLDAAEVVGTAALAGAADLAAVDDVTALLVLPAVVEDPRPRPRSWPRSWAATQATYLADLDEGRRGHRQDRRRHDDRGAHGPQDRDRRGRAGGRGVPAGVHDGGRRTAPASRSSTSPRATTATVELEGGAAGLAQVSGVDDGTQLYVTSTDGTTGDPEITVISITGDRAENGPEVREDFPLPESGTRVVYDDAAELVYVLGTTPDGAGTTVYVVEPHGKSVFADHRLPFAPTALVLDHNKDFPTTSHGSLLAFAAGGEAASLDVGSYTFAWRLPGVIMGALTVAVLFLLARVLFRRRAVGVLVGLFVLLDGMFFVQSRIAMNDVYTGVLHPRRLPAVRVAVAGARTRQALLLAGDARHGRPPGPRAGVQVGRRLRDRRARDPRADPLGPRPDPAHRRHDRDHRRPRLDGASPCPLDSGGAGNLPFILIMIGLTLATVVLTVYRPVAWSDDEMRFAVAAPAAVGILIALTGDGAGQGGGEHRPRARSSSRRSRWASRSCWSACSPTPRSTSAAGWASARWRRRPIPTRAARPATGLARPRGLGAPGLGPRPAGRRGWRRACSRSRSAVYVALVRAVGADREPPARRRLARRHTRARRSWSSPGGCTSTTTT